MLIKIYKYTYMHICDEKEQKLFRESFSKNKANAIGTQTSIYNNITKRR